jgi:peptide/nickel transport system substrate-binding protein
VFRAIPEDSTRVAEVLTGGVDIAINIAPSDMKRIDANPTTYTLLHPSQRIINLVVRSGKDWVTGDQRIREAIDLAIDKKSLVDNVVDGAGVPTRTLVGPGNPGAQLSLYNTSLYDPVRAKQLLAEAGYPNGGPRITLASPTGRYMKDKEIAEFVAAQLQEVGFDVDLQIQEWSRFFDLYSTKKHKEIYLFGNGNSMFDPALRMEPLVTARAKGTTDYSNPAFDKLVDAATKNLDPASRAAQYQQAQEIIAEDRPLIPLFQTKFSYGVNKRIIFKPRLDEMIPLDDVVLADPNRTDTKRAAAQ